MNWQLVVVGVMAVVGGLVPLVPAVRKVRRSAVDLDVLEGRRPAPRNPMLDARDFDDAAAAFAAGIRREARDKHRARVREVWFVCAGAVLAVVAGVWSLVIA